MSDKKYDFSDFDEPVKPQAKAQSYDFSDFEAPKAPEESTKLESAVGGLTQGATLGFGDELEGMLSALLRPTGLVGAGGAVGDISTASPTLDLDTIKEEYYRSRDAARQRLDKQKEDNPLTYGGTELAGGFATPAFGAAKAVGAATKGATGVMNAIKTGAIAGATGSAAANVGYADELKNIDPAQLGQDALTGGAVGGVLGGALKGVGNVAGMIADSDIGQKISKVYNKTKEGINLSGKGASEGFNKELRDVSSNIVDELLSSAEKVKKQYGEVASTAKITDIPKFQNDVEKIIQDLAEGQKITRKIDILKVEDDINKLRKDNRLNDDEIISIKDKIMEAARVRREMSNKASYDKAQKSIEGQSVKSENLDVKKSFEDQVRTAQDELIEARRAYQDNPMDRVELKLEVRAKEDALRAIRREAKDAGFDMSGQSIETGASAKKIDTLNKSSKDVLTQTDDLQAKLDGLQKRKIEINREIADQIESKLGKNNAGLSDLLENLRMLQNVGDDASYQQIKNNIMNLVESSAETIKRPDLPGKINDILKKNIKELSEINSNYAKMSTELDELGVKLGDFSSDTTTNASVQDNITQMLKMAAKDPTGLNANRLQTTQGIIKNQKVNQLLNKGVDIGENYNLSKDISQAGLKSVGLRGAAVVGDAMNNSITRAAKRLGNSSLGKKVQEIVAMPEGDARNRAMFLLGQQSWFRNASKDENEK